MRLDALQQFVCTTDGCARHGIPASLGPLSLGPFAVQRLDPLCAYCSEPMDKARQ